MAIFVQYNLLLLQDYRHQVSDRQQVKHILSSAGKQIFEIITHKYNILLCILKEQIKLIRFFLCWFSLQIWQNRFWQLK